MNKTASEALGAIIEGLTDFVTTVARETAEKRVNELRSGVVTNPAFDCCPTLWPWFYSTFVAHARVGTNGPPDQEQKIVRYREHSINYCPFCGTKL